MADDRAAQTQAIWPVSTFHFRVTLDDTELAFQEVSGLESTVKVAPLAEGGENRFVHQLPKPAKHRNIVLKRGVTENSSPLVKWCKATLEGDLTRAIASKSLEISLLNEDGTPVATWSLGNAYPVKWSLGGFDATTNKLAIETVELAATTLSRDM